LRSRALLYAEAAWIRDYSRAIQISLLGYAVGGAFLEVDYWDFFYQLVTVCVLLKVMLNKIDQKNQDAQVSNILKKRVTA
jgi:hypothetical protein